MKIAPSVERTFCEESSLDKALWRARYWETLPNLNQAKRIRSPKQWPLLRQRKHRMVSKLCGARNIATPENVQFLTKELLTAEQGKDT